MPSSACKKKLLKEIPIDEVADAIRSVWAGQSRISPSMASKLLIEFAAMCKASGDQPFFFNDPATTEIYTLPLHDALPIARSPAEPHRAAEQSTAVDERGPRPPRRAR